MQGKNFDWLNHVPYRGKDAGKELEDIIVASSTFKALSVKEKQRLDYEMEMIKKVGAAKVFLFGYELVGNDCCGTTLLAEGCSFINYLLGINKVNPVLYDLPFERFFNLSTGEKPVYNIYTTKGNKEKILKHLYGKFGENLFFQNRTHTAIYFVSSKSEENQIIASHERKSPTPEYRELIESDFYRFGILDSILKIDNSITTIFTEKEILQKKRELFGERGIPVWEYTTINEVVDFLKDTEYKLVYQEQFLLLCNCILGIDYETAEFYRQGYLRKKKEALIGFESLIHKKYPEKGEKFLQYFNRVMPYTVCKSYVIAHLYNQIEWLDE